jgi:hypothetical protein
MQHKENLKNCINSKFIYYIHILIDIASINDWSIDCYGHFMVFNDEKRMGIKAI